MAVEHGLRGYHHGCKCATCRAAVAEYQREYQRRRRLNDGKPLRRPRTTDAERMVKDPYAERAHAINSRTRAVGGLGRVTGRELKKLIEAYSGVCAYCGRPWEQIDHFIPLSRGGTSWIDNLRPTCWACNYLKSTYRLEDWKPWARFKPGATTTPTLWDRLRGRSRPNLDFGMVKWPREPFRFPTAGWDSTRPMPGPEGVLSGSGFLMFDDVHIPQIEQTGGIVTKVAGTSYYKGLRAFEFSPGMALVLIPEPSNPHDANAVGVWDAYRHRQAGWIPKPLSQTVAEGIRSATLRHSMCLWEWTLDAKRVGIRILVAPGPPVPQVWY